jgi:hypothetical protein
VRDDHPAAGHHPAEHGVAEDRQAGLAAEHLVLEGGDLGLDAVEAVAVDLALAGVAAGLAGQRRVARGARGVAVAVAGALRLAGERVHDRGGWGLGALGLGFGRLGRLGRLRFGGCRRCDACRGDQGQQKGEGPGRRASGAWHRGSLSRRANHNQSADEFRTRTLWVKVRRNRALTAIWRVSAKPRSGAHSAGADEADDLAGRVEDGFGERPDLGAGGRRDARRVLEVTRVGQAVGGGERDLRGDPAAPLLADLVLADQPGPGARQLLRLTAAPRRPGPAPRRSPRARAASLSWPVDAWTTTWPASRAATELTETS